MELPRLLEYFSPRLEGIPGDPGPLGAVKDRTRPNGVVKHRGSVGEIDLLTHLMAVYPRVLASAVHVPLVLAAAVHVPLAGCRE
jgi:hypothetical protein